MRKLFLAILIFVAGAAATIIARTDPNQLSASEIAKLTLALNEAAAIGVPHGFLMDEKTRQENLPLLTRVESGAALDTADSKAYRIVFQNTLHLNRSFLGKFDAELTVLFDHAFSTPNNIDRAGIIGYHDHHDVSARKNFAGLLNSLERLDRATTFLGRIRYANAVQKDLVDLISHVGVAPHTVSIPYVAPSSAWSDQQLGASFEAMLQHYKMAQFSDVNSPAYWVAVDAALQNYDVLILEVQHRVLQRTAAWERRVAGRFLSIQTLAPPVDLSRALRRR